MLNRRRFGRGVRNATLGIYGDGRELGLTTQSQAMCGMPVLRNYNHDFN